MESGEFELRKVFEDVTRNNVNTVIGYSKDTRKVVRELEITVQALSNMVVSQNQLIEELKRQLAAIQQKLYANGS